jgi:eukaryotic-like serine/threonine-protein kinase
MQAVAANYSRPELTMLAANSILQNRYRVIRQLGQGGMGAVYEAIDERVSCVVALKETLVGANSEARQAFQREAALLANLRHQALPKVMDYFTEDERAFLIMEFIPGHDLAELLEKRGAPFTQENVLQWADQLLNLLQYLHSQNPPILHRDIKPANLKVTNRGEIVLLDFGLAKGSAGEMQSLYSSRSVFGYTPVYSPIEQIHGRGTDQRSDLTHWVARFMSY